MIGIPLVSDMPCLNGLTTTRFVSAVSSATSSLSPKTKNVPSDTSFSRLSPESDPATNPPLNLTDLSA